VVTLPPGNRYYYVSPQGNDSNPGTKESPFKTIQKAASAAYAGDVTLIQAGIYYEDVKPLRSGKPGKYITYQNMGDGEVIIDAENGTRGGCIEIDNKGYLQFIRLTVRGANSYENWPRAGISMTDGANHIILDKITAYNNYVGIMAHGGETPLSFITVKNSKTFSPVNNTGNIHYGILFYKKVLSSKIINNHVAYTLPEDQSYGIEISTDYPGVQDNGARQISVIGNEVDHNESQGIHTWNAVGVLIRGNYLHDNGATGIQIENGSENIVIENNLSENNAQKYEFEAGAWIDDTKNAVVRNNILRKNKIGLTITDSERVIIHDNFIYLNNRGAENLYNVAGAIVDGSDANISITQNTFYKNGVTGMERGAVNFAFSNHTCADIVFKNNIVAQTVNRVDFLQDSCSDFVSDFNDFYNTRPTAFEWNLKRVGWATYRTISKQDAHSLTKNPLFANPSTFIFSLKPTSPLIGKGAILARAVSSGSGNTVIVTNAGYFSDGFGIGTGDLIVVGGNLVSIIAIDYAKNSLTINRTISWNKNDAISFPFTGMAPNMGASKTP
jgi:parallel beta-helix repeat protein